MSCVPYAQWIQANADCKARTSLISVKGFGYVPAGVRGLRGLGLGDSLQVSTLLPPVVGMSVTTSAPAINTANVDPTDPCVIAAQTSCPAGTGCPAVCPTGHYSINLLVAPGAPPQCVCAKTKVAATAPNATIAVPSSGSASAPASSGGGSSAILPASTTAGFNHWGLLAALAVGGAALYIVTRK